MVNCPILGCLVSRRAKYKGLRIFKVPSGDSEFETTWRNKLNAIIIRDRVIDAKLKEQIYNRNIYICHQPYRTDKYLIHDTCKTFNPAEVSTLNLPVKSIPSIQPCTKIFSKEYFHQKAKQYTIFNFNYCITLLQKLWWI